ncbi:MAG: YggS family pyridoxal phosphate-dependent enzyme [Chloroflexi bacterium]|uniref:YggS family pyridoxal phosphate-dependent enzyme n=1 Tax=Candidatus Flexifilum breve TaxID=3140694 RepID=UPI0031370E99|nr:YggS family pyridoxal phosphate-dependent enzyme [Chloroflexota bacterium]
MSIAENIQQVRETIAAACVRAGRDPASVTLIAVSKTRPVEMILAAVAAGVQHFGENRVEEAESKIPQVNVAATWHMIGHIQSRKAKDVLPLFNVVHSVDRFKLAEKLARAVVERGGRLDVLIEINISGEESKGGLPAFGWQTDPAVRAAVWDEIRQISALPGLKVRGLMTMAPIVPTMEAARPVFVGLRELRDHLSASLGVSLPELSMGMTDDYPVAVEEGATMVRIGRAIFGER